MTVLPDDLAAHLAEDVTTVCACWRLTRRDGTVLGFTDHDRPLTIAGTIFLPETGLSGTEAQESLGLAVDTQEVEGALKADAISKADIAAGRFDGAVVETLLVNWQRPQEHVLLRRATIGKMSRLDGRHVAELVSAAGALDRARPIVVARRCCAELGDARCRVDLGHSGLAGSGTVLAQEEDGRLVASGLGAFSPGWFASGRLTMVSGPFAGETFAVTTHERMGATALLGFWAPPPELPPGDAFTLTAGCDKRFETCRTKFANSLNFRGFPHLPGNDAAYTYVSGGAVFDGGALVP